MKKKRHCPLIFTFALMLSILFPAGTRVFAYEWKALLFPASLNTDNTIRLAKDEVQGLDLVLQADKEVTTLNTSHTISLEWNLPAGMNIVGNGGYAAFTSSPAQKIPGRNVFSFQVQIANGDILGEPGADITTEWHLHTLFVATPPMTLPGQNYVQLKLTDGAYVKKFTWPLELSALLPPRERPKRITLGLWDYTYDRATGEAASGVAKFFQDSGIAFTETTADNSDYLKSLQAQGILTGGFIWGGFYSDAKYTDYSAAGAPDTGGFPDPQAIIDLPPEAEIPGVKQMVSYAKAGDGIATFDYEPSGQSGFGPFSVAAFKKEYGVSDADFQKFREHVAEKQSNASQSSDPVISHIWRQWTQFRTAQTGNYIRRISQAFKAQMPEGRIAITPSFTYGKDSPGTLAFGCDNAAMAPYTDIIMPQIYNGYAGTDAKIAMDMTSGWHDEILRQKTKTQLWPLLLVRFAGAGIKNSPQRLRQQIIGCLANGANGILLYYPGMMDAPYWGMLARTSEDVAQYENFYQDGTRVDGEFLPSGMPAGSVQIPKYSDYEATVKNPAWSFTAHQLGKKVLLTIINLQDSNALVFSINNRGLKVLSRQGAKQQSGDQWLIAPGEIGFIVLGQNSNNHS